MSYFEFKTYSGKYLNSREFKSFLYATSHFYNIYEKEWFSDFNQISFWYGYGNCMVYINAIYEVQLTENGLWDWDEIFNGLNGILDIHSSVNEADLYSNVGVLKIGNETYEPAVLDEINFKVLGKSLTPYIMYVKISLRFLLVGISYDSGAKFNPIYETPLPTGSVIKV